MNEKQPIGLLFDSIAFHTPNELDSLCNDITIEQSYFMIIKALEYSYKSGIFSLQESELVSKSLRVMNSHFTKEFEE